MTTQAMKDSIASKIRDLTLALSMISRAESIDRALQNFQQRNLLIRVDSVEADCLLSPTPFPSYLRPKLVALMEEVSSYLMSEAERIANEAPQDSATSLDR